MWLERDLGRPSREGSPHLDSTLLGVPSVHQSSCLPWQEKCRWRPSFSRPLVKDWNALIMGIPRLVFSAGAVGSFWVGSFCGLTPPQVPRCPGPRLAQLLAGLEGPTQSHQHQAQVVPFGRLLGGGGGEGKGGQGGGRGGWVPQ